MGLIDTDEAVEHFRRVIEAITNNKDAYNEGFIDALEFCISTLSTMPAAEQMGWTPTSVKPPKEFEYVFIQFTYGDYGMSKYIPPRFGGKKRPDGYWGDTDDVDYEYFDVVAWRPLPEPYKGDKHE